MKISDLGLAIIELFEDFRSTAYQDQRGVWTCGYGHTAPDVREGTTCTSDQASEWLAADTEHAETAVQQLVTTEMRGHEFDALVSFVYNAGTTALKDSTLLKLVNAGKILEASDQFLIWDHVNGAPNAGLLRRRKVERALFLDGGDS